MPVSSNHQQNRRLPVLSAAFGVLLVAAGGSAGAAGTTGDFGKDLNRTTTLHHFQVDKEKFVGQRFEFHCPAKTARDTEAGIYGTDVYPASSPICVAATHAGAVGDEGGPVTLQLNPGVSEYEGSLRNDVESADFPGTSLSIMFLTDATRDEMDRLQRKWIPRLAWDDKFSQTGLANIRLTGQRFAFQCPAGSGNMAGRRVYGTDSYPLNSYVCMAAVHAGQISDAGGFVLVQMDPALEGKFAGSIRNGIESKNGPKSPRSISFPGSGQAGTAHTAAPVDSAATATPAIDDAKDRLEKSTKGMLSGFKPR